jgi:hypothetical protein
MKITEFVARMHKLGEVVLGEVCDFFAISTFAQKTLDIFNCVEKL